MRALAAGLATAARFGGGTPDVRVELLDLAPHYNALYSGGPDGRSGAVITFDGALAQAYVDSADVVYVRRVTAPAATPWPTWTAIGAGYTHNAGVAVALLPDRVRVLAQSGGGSTRVSACDSFDNGMTWSSFTVLFDAGAPLGGIAGDGDPYTVFGVYQVAANQWRVATWAGGTFLKSDWTNGDSYGQAGIGAVNRAPLGQSGHYVVAAALQATAASGYAVVVATYAGTWTAPAAVAPADLGGGSSVYEPHLSIFDGRLHLAYGVSDANVFTQRVAVAQSIDGVHWSDPLPDAGTYQHGAALVRHAAGYVLAGADAASLAAPYTGARGQYRDCTVDLVSVEASQRDGSPAGLVVRLMNEQGQYLSVPAVRPNAVVRLSLGYAGAGVVPTHIGYVDEWVYQRAADLSLLEIRAGDVCGWLDRQSRTTLEYTNQTVGYLAREVLARAGILAVEMATTAQFSEVVPQLTVNAGGTWRQAFDRLAKLYGFDAAARVDATGGDYVVVYEKGAGDAVVWTYGDEVDQVTVAHSGDRANHVLVYGVPVGLGSPPIVGEAWDFADLSSAGQERYLHVVDPLITTVGGATLRATLELAIEGRRSLAGTGVVAMNPGLELGDVVLFTDGVLPPTTARLRALLHYYDAGHPRYDLVLEIEGV